MFLAIAVLLLIDQISATCNVKCPKEAKSGCSSFKHRVESAFPKSSRHDPDIGLSVYDLIRSKGYPAENHTVITSDGYILQIHRIPHGKEESGNNRKKPVAFLQHGLVSSSADWVMNFPKNSWGYILADLGFDVWMGNVRGNTYSSAHVKLNTSDPAFWKFSVDEFAKYDLKESIDYVLKLTGETQLSYVGHSMGTVMLFLLLSTMPNYNEKVKVAVLFAPQFTYKCSVSPLNLVAPIEDIARKLLRDRPIFQNDALTKTFARYACGTTFTNLACHLKFISIVGFHPCLNRSRHSVIASYYPSGSSTNAMLHFVQAKRYGFFHMYDFGAKENINKYGQAIPPAYDVKKITSPIGLFHSCNDIYADLSDVKYLEDNLQNLTVTHTVLENDFAHADFTFTIDKSDDLIISVIELLKKYNNLHRAL